MSRSYRMCASVEINAPLSEADCTVWQDILYRCVDDPEGVLAEGEQDSNPEDVEIQRWEDETQFCLDMERNLCGGYSEAEYAEDFQKAMALLTKDVPQDFKVTLSLYYLEHGPDLYVSFERQDLAV